MSVAAAYEILSDPERRQNYDAGGSGQAGGPQFQQEGGEGGGKNYQDQSMNLFMWVKV
jgi:DnaJ-class molecular chaperone